MYATFPDANPNYTQMITVPKAVYFIRNYTRTRVKIDIDPNFPVDYICTVE